MGVPIVFHHDVNQPHTPSPHFSSFPTWTPRLSLCGSIFYLHLRSIMNPPFHPQSVCPSADLPSFHLPRTETHQWGPHPSLVFQDNSALPGARISHWGTRFCICTFLPKIIHYLLYKCCYYQSLHFLLSSLLATCFLLATRNPCHPWLEHYLSSTLVGIVHIFRVLHRSLTSTL
jgi:hypothetical protein